MTTASVFTVRRLRLELEEHDARLVANVLLDYSVRLHGGPDTASRSRAIAKAIKDAIEPAAPALPGTEITNE